VGVIALGLLVHETGLGLPPAARDFLGDALWAVMTFAWFSVLWPRGSIGVRAVLAVSLCWIVEASQAYHTPSLDALRQTTVGQLVLGSGFDPRDLAAYALGVLFGALLQYFLVEQST
jgi:hypothetical protein